MMGEWGEQLMGECLEAMMRRGGMGEWDDPMGEWGEYGEYGYEDWEMEPMCWDVEDPQYFVDLLHANRDALAQARRMVDEAGKMFVTLQAAKEKEEGEEAARAGQVALEAAREKLAGFQAKLTTNETAKATAETAKANT